MTKRVFEVARELGVETKTVIKTLQDNNIKVGNFSGVDDHAKAILKRTFAPKKQEQRETVRAAVPKHTKNTYNNAAQQTTNKGNVPRREGNDQGERQHSSHSSHLETTVKSGIQQKKSRISTGSTRDHDNRDNKKKFSNSQNQQHRDGKFTNSGGQRQNSQGTQKNDNRGKQHPDTRNGQTTNSQNSQHREGNSQPSRQQGNGQAAKQGSNKRTKYFARPQQNNDAHNNHHDKNNKHTQATGHDNKKNTSNSKNINRPHTLLSNVLNKNKNKNKGHRSIQHGQREGFTMNAETMKKKKYPTTLEIGDSITVKDFAEKLDREVGEVIKKLLLGGIMATINQEIDYDTASLIADEFNVSVTKAAPPEDPTEIEEIIDPPESLKLRPPVVTIMGHVDHGKTSLLDAIRQTNVTSHEAGGITQHIGAYQVRYNGKKIVFMDTPGHEAFTAMRARGAQVTDIAVLVVAADDGVMPQTIESINHAKSAGVPVIVAINKIDKEGANPSQVMQQLTEYGLVGEEWGGDTIMVPVSAHKKIGLDELLENILVLAEVLDLKANPNRPAQGVVIEAKLDKGRGSMASVLIQKGTLHVGDTVIVGTCYGNVRAMTNERGERMKKAEPSIPVEILGLNDVPEAGDILNVVDEKTARSVAEKRMEKKRTSELHQHQKVTLDDLFNQIQQGELKELSLIVKGDVQGSVEALSQSLEGIKSEEVRITIVHAGVGAITESDVMLASASNALIIGFNVRPDAAARKMAEHEHVDLRTYRVIYDAINDVEAAMKGMLEKKMEEKVLGRAQVRKVITTPKVIVAGSYVTEGKMSSSAKIRLIRNGIVVHEGEVDSLRRFKDDVKEVQEGYECGITLEGYRDVKEGDEMEAYIMVEVETE
ncbi:MAG: translation initiation factor IF-2 [Megasphaera sp.]|jgi:translation initiation factor IF-2|uniref:translation initiation factor IF-2 n=1 Tax=Megasphaera sueciensis TaxID=349094 RepID=UPI003D00B70F|nr:translation initiation factor IF-2 [Megasphaera sp.]MCI1822768.1 translation initiation factor IF-2 [Megasphaera sp.]